MQTANALSELVANALAAAQETGSLPPCGDAEVRIEVPQQAEHGDFSTSLPLRLARATRMAPLTIGEAIVAAMPAKRPHQPRVGRTPGIRQPRAIQGLSAPTGHRNQVGRRNLRCRKLGRRDPRPGRVRQRQSNRAAPRWTYPRRGYRKRSRQSAGSGRLRRTTRVLRQRRRQPDAGLQRHAVRPFHASGRP